MIVELDELARMIDFDLTQQRDLREVGPHIKQIFGRRADVIYVNVGEGYCEVLALIPARNFLR